MPFPRESTDFPWEQYTFPEQPDNSSNSMAEIPPVQKASPPERCSCPRLYNHICRGGSPADIPAAVSIHTLLPRNDRSGCNRRDVFPETGFQKTKSPPNHPGEPQGCILCPAGLNLPGSRPRNPVCIHLSYRAFPKTRKLSTASFIRYTRRISPFFT